MKRYRLGIAPLGDPVRALEKAVVQRRPLGGSGPRPNRLSGGTAGKVGAGGIRPPQPSANSSSSRSSSLDSSSTDPDHRMAGSSSGPAATIPSLSIPGLERMAPAAPGARRPTTGAQQQAAGKQNWARALNHYSIALQCGAPLRPEHAFRVASVFAQGYGSREQFLRWWALFRCEALPPSSSELAALHHHDLWKQALYTVGMAEPWSADLAKEAATLFASPPLHHVHPPNNTQKLSSSYNPEEEGDEAFSSLEGNLPRSVVSHLVSRWELSLALLLTAPEQSNSTLPVKAAKGSKKHLVPFVEARRELSAVPRQTLGPTGVQQHNKRGKKAHCIIAQAIRACCEAARGASSSNHRLALAVALRLHQSEAYDPEESERAVAVASSLSARRQLSSQSVSSSSPVSALVSAEESQPILLHYAQQEMQAGRSAVVTPSVGNILAALSLKEDRLDDALKYLLECAKRFSPAAVSALVLHRAIQQWRSSIGSGGLQDAETMQLASEAFALCAVRIRHQERKDLGTLYDEMGDWQMALALGGVELALEHAAVDTTVGSVGDGGSGQLDPERQAHRMAFAAESLFQSVNAGDTVTAAKIADFVSSQEDSTTAGTGSSDSPPPLSIPALDALATTQVQQGHWVGAIKTIQRLVALANAEDTDNSTSNRKNTTTGRDEGASTVDGGQGEGRSLLEEALLDSVRSVETWRDALDLFS